MKPRPPANHVWDDYWGSVYRRLERGTAWILLSVGSTLLIGYGLWRMLDALLGDTNVPEIVRWSLLATLLGFAILMISVVREKITRNRTDSYQDVAK